MLPGFSHGIAPRQLAASRFDDAPLLGRARRWRRRSRARRGARSRLTLTENRSVLLSFRRAAARVPPAPAPHVPARAARGGARRWRAACAARSRSADGEVRRFMNENLHRVRKRAARSCRRS